MPGMCGVYVHATKAVRATMTLHPDAPAKAWVNGAPVYERTIPRAGQVPESSFLADLNAGWNTVQVKVVATAPSAPFSLRVAGDGLEFSTKPE